MKRLCRIRNIGRAVSKFEEELEERYGLCLNEAIVLCTLNSSGKQLSSGDIAERVGLTPSNASKVISSVEQKGLIGRIWGRDDKRRAYFELTPEGRSLLKGLDWESITIPPPLDTIVDEMDMLVDNI